MTRLRTCDGCSRHVLASESSCPFCQRVLAPAQLLAAPSAPPGLSRAQRLTLAAAAVAGQALAACSSDASQAVPVYGAPISGAPGAGGSGTAGKGAVAVPVYGAPVAGRTGGASGSSATQPDAGDAEDAGVATNPPKSDGGTMVQPLYGAPVPVYGAPLPQK
jgi:hypothetical protein